MFKDAEGNELAIGDEVTVGRSQRHRLADGSHGVIQKFGTKLVHVRLTLARTEMDDGRIYGFEPQDLRKGHHGRPRHPQGWFGEMQETLISYRNNAFDQLITTAVERGVITAGQGEAMKLLYDEVK